MAVGAFSARGLNLALFVALAVGGAAWVMLTPTHRRPSLAAYQQMAAEPISTVPDPGLQAASLDALAVDGLPRASQALSPQAAILENAEIPFSARGAAPSPSFVMNTADTTLTQQSLNCMTQAVYYEAASEPLEGQRAVAQVVLNRLRNPIFPKTVCGVVYQGSGKSTGCQFTFTCDGSLARTPNPKLWDRAQAVAAQALAGAVQPAVGDATNYHADYVAPPWSHTLVKLTQIGQHIFYSMVGARTVDPAALEGAGMGAAPMADVVAPQLSVAAAEAPAPAVKLQAAPPAPAASLAQAALPVAARIVDRPPPPPRLAMRAGF